MSAPPAAASFQARSPDSGSTQYNGNIIIASLALLCFVVLFILALHIYAKWFWRRSQQRQAVLWHRRQPLRNLPDEQQQQQQQAFAVGLDKAVIDSLPTFIYRLSKKGAMECAVCLSELQENDEGRLLPKCSHSFHTECIDMWFLSHTTCPLCRTSAGPAEPQPSMAPPPSELGGAEAEAVAAGLNAALSNDGETPPGLDRPTAEAAAIPEVLPSPGWRWRRSTSDRFSQNPQNGVQFPTNVLFWGNHSHVSSHTNPPQVSGPPRLEHGQRGARSLPHMVLDMPIPRSMHTLMAGRSTSSGAGQPRPTSHAERPVQQQDKAAGSGLSVFKRLLSRERKVFPTEQEMGTCGHSAGMSSEATPSGP